jgi:DNA-binding MarR family transcriptional regulator
VISVLLTEKKRALYSEVFRETNTQFHDIFSQIKDEFEDHLTTINENTNEIQANYELLCNIDQKLNKLAERMDKMELFFQQKGLKTEEKETFKPVRLSKREQEIFLILYTLEEVKGSVTYLDIARRVGLPEDIVTSYISNMLQRGVPIIKKYIANEAHLSLNPKFKSLQAKENILKIEQRRLTL